MKFKFLNSFIFFGMCLLLVSCNKSDNTRDTDAPYVTNISSTAANGSYRNQSVPITVTFSENVTVTGSPQLSLSSGGTAVYASGSGTATLTFSYT